jgi:hypothetical protein
VRDVQELLQRGVRLLHVYSEGDEGLDYFRVMLGRRAARLATANEGFEVRLIAGANHVLTQRWSQDALVELCQEWIAGLRSPRGAVDRGGYHPRR